MGQCFSKPIENNFLEKYVALKKGTNNGIKDNKKIDVSFWSNLIDYECSKIALGIQVTND